MDGDITVTWQHQDRGGPAIGARELLELGPAVDGLVSQSFGAEPRVVHRSAGDQETEDIFWLRRATLRIKLNGYPANAVWEGNLKSRAWKCDQALL